MNQLSKLPFIFSLVSFISVLSCLGCQAIAFVWIILHFSCTDSERLQLHVYLTTYLVKDVQVHAWGFHHYEIQEGPNICNLNPTCKEAILMFQIHDIQVTMEQPYQQAKPCPLNLSPIATKNSRCEPNPNTALGQRFIKQALPGLGQVDEALFHSGLDRWSNRGRTLAL